MQVLRHGNTYREVECKKCGALLSYFKADIEIDSRYNAHFGGHDSIKKYIICPECEERIIFSWIIDGEETIK